MDNIEYSQGIANVGYSKFYTFAIIILIPEIIIVLLITMYVFDIIFIFVQYKGEKYRFVIAIISNWYGIRSDRFGYNCIFR